MRRIAVHFRNIIHSPSFIAHGLPAWFDVFVHDSSVTEPYEINKAVFMYRSCKGHAVATQKRYEWL